MEKSGLYGPRNTFRASSTGCSPPTTNTTACPHNIHSKQKSPDVKTSCPASISGLAKQSLQPGTKKDILGSCFSRCCSEVVPAPQHLGTMSLYVLYCFMTFDVLFETACLCSNIMSWWCEMSENSSRMMEPRSCRTTCSWRSRNTFPTLVFTERLGDKMCSFSKKKKCFKNLGEP